MLWRTHLLFGLFLCTFFPFNISWLFLLLGCLLPDIDTVSSILGRRFKLIGHVFEHRGFFHSLFGLALFSGFGYSITHNWAMGVGYLSHLGLDMLTRQGLVIYPSSFRIRGPVTTGGFLEWLFFGLFFLLLLIRL